MQPSSLIDDLEHWIAAYCLKPITSLSYTMCFSGHPSRYATLVVACLSPSQRCGSWVPLCRHRTPAMGVDLHSSETATLHWLLLRWQAFACHVYARRDDACQSDALCFAGLVRFGFYCEAEVVCRPWVSTLPELFCGLWSWLEHDSLVYCEVYITRSNLRFSRILIRFSLEAPVSQTRNVLLHARCGASAALSCHHHFMHPPQPGDENRKASSAHLLTMCRKTTQHTRATVAQ